jgi:hypothetical protein
LSSKFISIASLIWSVAIMLDSNSFNLKRTKCLDSRVFFKRTYQTPSYASLNISQASSRLSGVQVQLLDPKLTWYGPRSARYK